MTDQPKVLLIGDSISLGYGPHVERELRGRFRVAHHEGNCGDSANLLAHLSEWLAVDADAAAVHFNVGLHDLKRPRDGSGLQVPPESYERNMERIVSGLKATGKCLIWATITPVIYERHLIKQFDRRQEDVQAYNAAALRVIEAAGIPVDDLHAFVVGAGVEKLIGEDGVHFNEEGYRLLGEQVCRAINRHAGSA